MIGIAATYTYNERQRKNSEDQKHREITIQKVQTIQSFMPQLQSEDSKTVEAALLAITALGDPELATDLAGLFKSEGAISALEKNSHQSRPRVIKSCTKISFWLIRATNGFGC